MGYREGWEVGLVGKEVVLTEMVIRIIITTTTDEMDETMDATRAAC